MSARPFSVALVAVLAACGAGAGSSPAVTRDSAGISIVENAAPDSTIFSFTIDSIPSLLLGELDGPEAEQFGYVTGAMRLASGQIVVADRNNYELRVFDSAGTLVRRIGRRGEGPGDFGELAALLEGPSGIHTWDWRLHRVTAFAEDGSFLRDQKIAYLPAPDSSPGRMVPFPLHVLPDGRIIARGGRMRFNTPTGNYQDSIDVWIVDSAGEMRRFGAYYSRSHYVLHTPDGSMWFGSKPFGPQGEILVTDAELIRSDGSAFEIRYLSHLDSLSRIVRVNRPVRAVTESDREWYMDSVVADYPPEYHEAERRANEWAEWSATVPAYDALIQDSEGQLWARVYPKDAPTATWDVFNADGRLVATASTPSGLDVKQIGRDWVLGQGKGVMDEPLVYLYRLSRDPR
jgi:hypothetical protein